MTDGRVMCKETETGIGEGRLRQGQEEREREWVLKLANVHAH